MRDLSNDRSLLSINSTTVKAWSLEQLVEGCVRAGISAISSAMPSTVVVSNSVRTAISAPNRSSSTPPQVLPRRLRVIPDAEGVDLPAAERAVADLLVALGKDPSTEHLADTPRRVARS